MFEQITSQINRIADTATTNVRRLDTDVDFAIDISEFTEFTDGFTTTSDKVLDAVLDTNRRVVDVAVSTADRVNERVELPFADRLPTPTVAGERYLDFVERAVSLNREMNQRVVELLGADRATAATAEQATARRAAAKTATTKPRTVKKNAAKKSTARKSTAKKSTARKSPEEHGPEEHGEEGGSEDDQRLGVRSNEGADAPPGAAAPPS
jgi:hypothetical protein